MTAPLTTLELEVLCFEDGNGWRSHDLKLTLIAERFEWSPTTYYAQLDKILDHPAALEYDPQLVARLRRLRDARRAARTAR